MKSTKQFYLKSIKTVVKASPYKRWTGMCCRPWNVKNGGAILCYDLFQSMFCCWSRTALGKRKALHCWKNQACALTYRNWHAGISSRYRLDFSAFNTFFCIITRTVNIFYLEFSGFRWECSKWNIIITSFKYRFFLNQGVLIFFTLHSMFELPSIYLIDLFNGYFSVLWIEKVYNQAFV